MKSMMRDTRKVANRRKLRYESVNDVLRDVDVLVAAEQAGTLRALGNWTLGQAAGHVAFWADAPYDGFPPMPPLPFFVRLGLSLIKRRLLNRGMPVGVRIRGVEAGTFGVEVLPTAEGVARLRNAFARLAAQAPTTPSPIFGPMTHEEWMKLNLRHAELHFSFFLRS